MNARTLPTLTIVFEPGEDGGWVASIPEVPGVVSQGHTKDQARDNVIDALREMMAYRHDRAVSAGRVEYEALSLS